MTTITDLLPDSSLDLVGARAHGVIASPRPGEAVFRNRTGFDHFKRPSKTFTVRYAGSVIDVTSHLHSEGKPRPSSPRGLVEGFSGASRRRLFKSCAALAWDVWSESVFITLTYPKEFTLDGRRAKRDLDALRRWLQHRNGGTLFGVWKMEFQRRGAVHFHMAILGMSNTRELRSDLSAAWFRIVASGDLKHLRAGTQVQPLRDNPAAYFAGYVGFNKGSKEYQHRVPEGYEGVGRFWGMWGVRPDWVSVEVSIEDFVQLRRTVSAWSRSVRVYDPRGSRIQGFWIHARSGGESMSAGLLLEQFKRTIRPGYVLSTQRAKEPPPQRGGGSIS